jgi:TonB family protein
MGTFTQSEKIMTRTIVAILALAPAMLLAQTKTPAQPSSTPVLEAALLQPVAFADLKSSDNASANTRSVRVSTGVVAPQLVQSVALGAGEAHTHILAATRTVVLEMTVDTTGKPTNLRIAQPVDPTLDKKVLAAVSQFRYKPGTLNGVPAAVPVRLNYVIEQGATY